MNDLGTVIIFKEYYFVVKENVTIFAVSNKKGIVHATTERTKAVQASTMSCFVVSTSES